jgi:hypothetical protein
VGQHAEERGGTDGKSKVKDEKEKEFTANPIRHILLLQRSLFQ